MYQTLIKPFYQDVKTFILDTLFPITCLSCNQEGFFICQNCKIAIKSLEFQNCIVCAKHSFHGITHPSCLTSWQADQLISCYDYHDKTVANIIIKGKYKFIPSAFETLGMMMAEKIKNNYPYLLNASPSFATNPIKTSSEEKAMEGRRYTLVPIPLHPSRKRWRGFNQAEILCEILSKELNLPVANVLQRKKITKTQKDLNKQDRQKNVTDAFVTSPPFQGGVGGGYFILVDDVTTTGSTLNQAAKILKKGGAEKVICLTVARD